MSEFGISIDPETAQELAQAGLTMRKAAERFAANMTATMAEFGASIGAAPTKAKTP